MMNINKNIINQLHCHVSSIGSALDRLTVFYISLVYSPFSDGIELPLHNIISSGVLMKSIVAEF